MSTASATLPPSSDHGVSEQSVSTVKMTSGSSLKHSFASLGIQYPGIENLNRRYPSSPSEPKEFVPRLVAWKDFGHNDVSHSIFALPLIVRHPNAKWQKGPIAIIGKEGGSDICFVVQRTGNGTVGAPYKFTATESTLQALPVNVRFFVYTGMDV